MKPPIIQHSSVPLTRRTTLKVGAASTVFSALPLLSACSSSGSGTETDKSDMKDEPNIGTNQQSAIKIGATIALSGAYGDEGLAQQRGLELAVQHLNGGGDGGMLSTMQPSSLQGNGVLGREVTFVVVDTETKAAVGETLARQLITDQEVSMLIGSSSSSVASSIQSVAEELGVVYMPGMAHANSLTGTERSAYGFRHYLNSRISAQALATTMISDLGAARSAYYLTADYSWGDITGGSIRQATEQRGWQTIGSVTTPVGASDYSTFLDGFINSGADVLILVHYGKDMIKSLTQAQTLGIPNMTVNGNAVAMGIPLYSTLMAEGAGNNCIGVYGTINWHWSLQDSASVNFTNSYETAYGVKPSEAAHVMYVQTMQYADAVERAGSVDACAVIAELEGHSFSGTGNGACEYRESDHQCFKDTLVVAGRNAPAFRADIMEVRNTVSRADVEYSADDLEFAGELGVCTSG